MDSVLRDRIKALREQRGYTLTEVAQYTGVADATVQRWESGNIKTIKQAHIAKLAMMFDCSPGYLMGWEDDCQPLEDTYYYPVIGRIPAGMPLSAVEYREGNVEVPKKIVERFGRNNLFALKITGDSMNKIVAPDSIGIFLKTESVENGSLVAVTIDGHDATLKRYVKIENYIMLKPESLNTEHQIQTFDTEHYSDFKIIGQLITTIKMFV